MKKFKRALTIILGWIGIFITILIYYIAIAPLFYYFNII